MILTEPWLFGLLKNPPDGMALFPFILLRKKSFVNDRILINHEKIHLRQQLELLIVPFYILYLLNYLFNRLVYKNHWQAYENICFEREAYRHQYELDYLQKRKWFVSFSYLKKQ